MSHYIHQLPDWPRFNWSQEIIAAPLGAVRHKQGRLLGRMEALGFSLRQEAGLETLTLDVVKTSEIEGETLNAQQVRSSIARRRAASSLVRSASSARCSTSRRCSCHMRDVTTMTPADMSHPAA